jgi:hypothetical protein
MIKLRAFLLTGGERKDRVVLVDGNTKMWLLREEVERILKEDMGHDAFKLTGVQLYPHWNREGR